MKSTEEKRRHYICEEDLCRDFLLISVHLLLRRSFLYAVTHCNALLKKSTSYDFFQKPSCRSTMMVGGVITYLDEAV